MCSWPGSTRRWTWTPPAPTPSRWAVDIFYKRRLVHANLLLSFNYFGFRERSSFLHPIFLLYFPVTLQRTWIIGGISGLKKQSLEISPGLIYIGKNQKWLSPGLISLKISPPGATITNEPPHLHQWATTYYFYNKRSMPANIIAFWQDIVKIMIFFKLSTPLLPASVSSFV